MEKKEHNQLAREDSIRNKENVIIYSLSQNPLCWNDNILVGLLQDATPGLIPLLNVEQAINEHFIRRLQPS
jgi:hypothetical protein